MHGVTMWELLADTTGREALIRAALLFAAIAGVAGLGAFIVSRFRGSMKEDRHPTSELLTKFRELHEQGKISDAEFRNIKTLMSQQHRQELNDNVQQS